MKRNARNVLASCIMAYFPGQHELLSNLYSKLHNILGKPVSERPLLNIDAFTTDDTNMINTIQEKLQELIEQKHYSHDDAEAQKKAMAAVLRHRASSVESDYSKLPFRYIDGLHIGDGQYKVKRSDGTVEGNWHVFFKYMEKDMSETNNTPHVLLLGNNNITKWVALQDFLCLNPEVITQKLRVVDPKGKMSLQNVQLWQSVLDNVYIPEQVCSVLPLTPLSYLKPPDGSASPTDSKGLFPRDKSVEELGSVLIGSVTLRAVKASVADFQGDVIVNAANKGCLSGGDLDGVITSKGGPALKEARLALPAFNLQQIFPAAEYSEGAVRIGPVLKTTGNENRTFFYSSLKQDEDTYRSIRFDQDQARNDEFETLRRLPFPKDKPKPIRCRTGRAVLTMPKLPEKKFGDLACCAVVHAVGPNFNLLSENCKWKENTPSDTLILTYARAFAMAAISAEAKSAAFPLISAGVYAGLRPIIDIAKDAVTALRLIIPWILEWEADEVKTVILCAFDDEQAQALTQALNDPWPDSLFLEENSRAIFRTEVRDLAEGHDKCYTETKNRRGSVLENLPQPFLGKYIPNSKWKEVVMTEQKTQLDWLGAGDFESYQKATMFLYLQKQCGKTYVDALKSYFIDSQHVSKAAPGQPAPGPPTLTLQTKEPLLLGNGEGAGAAPPQGQTKLNRCSACF